MSSTRPVPPSVLAAIRALDSWLLSQGSAAGPGEEFSPGIMVLEDPKLAIGSGVAGEIDVVFTATHKLGSNGRLLVNWRLSVNGEQVK